MCPETDTKYAMHLVVGDEVMWPAPVREGGAVRIRKYASRIYRIRKRSKGFLVYAAATDPKNRRTHLPALLLKPLEELELV